MRLEGVPQHEVARFLVERGYPVATEHTPHRRMVVDDKFVSDITGDPLFAGALKFGSYLTNLFEKYDFVTAVSPDDWDKLQEQTKKPYKIAGVIKANLMRGMVICGRCNRSMTSSISTKPEKDERRYLYKCETDTCEKKGKSVRAKVILEAAYAFLGEHPLGSERAYRRYIAELKESTERRAKAGTDEMKSLKAQKQAAEKRIEEIKRDLSQWQHDPVLKKEFANDLREQLKDIKQFNAGMKRIRKDQTAGRDTAISLEEFLELFKNLAKRVQKIDSMADLDFAMRKLFSNFVVKNKKVVEIRQNPMFSELSETKTAARDERSLLVTPRRIELRLKA